MNQHTQTILFFILCIIFLSGCSDNKTDANGLNQQAMVHVDLNPLPVPKGDSAEVQPDLGSQFNALAFDINKHIETERNFVYSPFSLHSLLTALSLGAKGDTKKQLTAALRLPETDTQYDAYSAWLNQILSDGSGEYTQFHHASAIWTDAKFNLNESFVTALKEQFHTQNQVVDFVHYAADVVDIINEWSNLNTNEMINNIVSQNDISQNTSMLLTCADSFNGRWATHFYPVQMTFYKPGSIIQSLNAIHYVPRTGYYYSSELHYSAAQLSFLNKKFSMLFILPHEVGGLNTLISKFTTQEFEKLIDGLELQNINITIPKFKIDYKAEHIKNLFNQIGLSNTFSTSSDYSSLSDNSVIIDPILTKASIEIDREGTFSSVPIDMWQIEEGEPSNQVSFLADHPFAFAIIHNPTKSILFYGHYYGE